MCVTIAGLAGVMYGLSEIRPPSPQAGLALPLPSGVSDRRSDRTRRILALRQRKSDPRGPDEEAEQ
eukprot:11132722-Alexandrium_andersonii.AAC.1